VSADVDGVAALVNEPVDGRRTLEAERIVQVSVGDRMHLEIVAGAAEKRRQLETLRTRWEGEGVPALRRAGVVSLGDLRALAATAREAEAAATRCGMDATRLLGEAAALRARADVHEAHAIELTARTSDVAEREAAIGSSDRQRLAASLQQLGSSWEVQAERLQGQKAKLAAAAIDETAKREAAWKLASYRATEAQGQAETLARQAESARETAGGAGGGVGPEALVREADAELAELGAKRAAIESDLRSLDAADTKAVSDARRAVVDAAGRLESAKKKHEDAREALTAARSHLDTKLGQVATLREEAARLDRAGAQARVETYAGEAALFAGDPVVNEDEIATAERSLATARQAVERVTRELDQEVGALTKVGGAAVREELTRVREALDGAKEGQRTLEIEADSWQLLRDTLREVENEEGAHLGRALAAPVSKGFVELTRGRYENVRLSATLKAESVEVSHVAAPGTEVLDALSVGTRNQLATLIRLTIADQLRSAIVLDDHLVNTDAHRLAWFRDLLMRTALNTQVIVMTCRPEDYLKPSEMPTDLPTRDLAGGAVRAIDVARLLRRADDRSSMPIPRPDRPSGAVRT
jgi:hypothetical protein